MFTKNWRAAIGLRLIGGNNAEKHVDVTDVYGVDWDFWYRSLKGPLTTYLEDIAITSGLNANLTGSGFGGCNGVAFGYSENPVAGSCNKSDVYLDNHSVTQTITINNNDDFFDLVAVYTIVNNNEQDFTINEVMIIHQDFFSNTTQSAAILDKTVLDEPITIPGNGGVGKITYTIHYDPATN